MNLYGSPRWGRIGLERWFRHQSGRVAIHLPQRILGYLVVGALFAPEGQASHAIYLGRINVAAVANTTTTGEHPRQRIVRNEEEEEHETTSRVSAAAPEFHAAVAAAPPPMIDRDFQALPDGGTTPPDTQGAVGPNDVMTMLNDRIEIQSKMGAERRRMQTGDFWPSSSDLTDPRLVYDPLGGRWLAMILKGFTPQTSWIYLAVSETSDPSGEWVLWGFDPDPSNVAWADYPHLGVNQSFVTLQANLTGGPGSVIFCIDKAGLYRADPTFGMTQLTDPHFSLVPAVSHDPGATSVYLLRNDGGQLAGGHGGAHLFRLDSLNQTALTDIGVVTAPDAWDDVFPLNAAVAPQLGSSRYIAINESRIINLVERNGSLWGAQHVFLPANGGTRSAVQWWQISTTGQRLQFSRIDDPSGAVMYGYPSIAVNANNDVLLGFSVFSASYYPSAGCAFHGAGDPLDSTRQPVIYKQGESAYDRGPTPYQRWGDYSATVVDPENDGDFWLIQQYAATPVGKWGTWWGHITVTLFPPFGIPASFSATGSGNSVDLEWNPVRGCAYYEVLRRAAGEPLHVFATTRLPFLIDSVVSANAAYLYAVRAVSAAGQRSGDSPPDLATTVTFTGGTLQPHLTLIRAIHINELRIAVNAVRAIAALSPAGSSVAAGSIVRATDIQNLRDGVMDARQQLGVAAVSFTDIPLAGNTITATHVADIRSSVQ
jgi:hypothetical protein